MMQTSVSPKVYAINTPGDIYLTDGFGYAPVMDIYAVRSANLRLAIRVRFDGNQARFATVIERSPTYVHRLLLPPDDKHAKNLGEALARQIETKLGLPARWLDDPHQTLDDIGSSGVQSMRETFASELSPPGVANVTPASLEPPSTARTVPLLPWRAALLSANALPRTLSPAPTEAPLPRVAVGAAVTERAFALRVRGDSMAPDFPDGCIIVVDPGRPHRSGDYVVAIKAGWSEPTFKRYVLDAGVAYLKSINPAYRQIELDPDAEIVGVVVEMRLTRTF
jgi:SOS-response transcriptional repressor LexA